MNEDFELDIALQETVLDSSELSDAADQPAAAQNETETTETVSTAVDYTAVIQDVGVTIANINLCCTLMILGAIMAMKLWEARR